MNCEPCASSLRSASQSSILVCAVNCCVSVVSTCLYYSELHHLHQLLGLKMCGEIVFFHHLPSPFLAASFSLFPPNHPKQRYPFFSAQLNTAIGALLAGLWLVWLPKDIETTATVVPWQSWAWLSALLACQNSLEILSIPRAPRLKVCFAVWHFFLPVLL